MSEHVTDGNAVESEQELTEAPDDNGHEEFDIERAKAKISKSNREAANLRARLKELETQHKEYEQWKESQKTEHERANERAEKAEKRAAELEMSILRNEVAAANGLTAAQAKRLQGSTKEELEEDAQELVAAFGASKPHKPGPRKVSGGSDPVEEGTEMDPLKLANMIRGKQG